MGHVCMGDQDRVDAFEHPATQVALTIDNELNTIPVHKIE